MRDYQTKQNKGGLPDSISSGLYGAGEFNSLATENEVAVSSSGQTLAPADGTGEDTNQLAMSLAIYGAGGAAYHKDTGAVNAYVLTPVSPRKSPPAYFDGFTVEFEPGNDNTGASTVNVAALGVVAIVNLAGAALVGDEISRSVTIRYSVAFSKFVLIIGADPTITATPDLKPVSASVAASALTVNLEPTSLFFRDSDLTDGAVTDIEVGTQISLIIPSGATLETVNAVESELVLVAIDNAGTVELAIINLAGGIDLSETGLINTVSISTGADLNDVFYSTTGRTGVPYRVVGSVVSTQATAGVWVTAPSKVQGAGGQSMIKTGLNAQGDAPIYACRAWVSFNGTGVVAIDSSGNVSSITDNSAGNYTVNFITPMKNALFAAHGNQNDGNLTIRTSRTVVGSMLIILLNATNGIETDSAQVSVSVFAN